MSDFTAFGMKLIMNYLKADDYLYLLNALILNLPAKKTKNILSQQLYTQLPEEYIDA